MLRITNKELKRTVELETLFHSIHYLEAINVFTGLPSKNQSLVLKTVS